MGINLLISIIQEYFMYKHTENYHQILQVLFLTVSSLERKKIRNKSALQSIQLVKLKLFHGVFPDTSQKNFLVYKQNYKKKSKV